jgi:hypothetical protein
MIFQSDAVSSYFENAAISIATSVKPSRSASTAIDGQGLIIDSLPSWSGVDGLHPIFLQCLFEELSDDVLNEDGSGLPQVGGGLVEEFDVGILNTRREDCRSHLL